MFVKIMDRFYIDVFMLNVAYLNNMPPKITPVRHYIIRYNMNLTLKGSIRIKIMQTFLRLV